MVVADAKMVEYHGQPQVESYVLTIMNMVSPRGARWVVLEAQDGRQAGPRVWTGGAASGQAGPGAWRHQERAGPTLGLWEGLLRRAGEWRRAGVTAAVHDFPGSP